MRREEAQWAIEVLRDFWLEDSEFDFSTLTCVGEEGELVHYQCDVRNTATDEEFVATITFKVVDDETILSHEIVDYEFEEVTSDCIM